MEKVIPMRFFKRLLEKELLQQAVLNKRRITLKKVLIQHMGLTLSRLQPVLRVEDIDCAGLGEELLMVSEILGIPPAEIPDLLEPLEIEVNGVGVALDGEMQFNEFRLRTLESAIYGLPFTGDLVRYKAYCQFNPLKGAEALNKKMKDRLRFEKKSVPAQSILKIQALQDFMQDLMPLVNFVPVLRLSVYDQLKTPAGFVSLHHLLAEDNNAHFSLLADHIAHKLEGIEETFH